MDEILLVLMVAVVGSLLLPAMQLARVVRTIYAHYRVSSIQSEPETDRDFKFRPLTEEEKKAFVNSLDAKGRQILAGLAGEATSASDPEPLNTTSPTIAP